VPTERDLHRGVGPISRFAIFRRAASV
jgi:hypothetical protein